MDLNIQMTDRSWEDAGSLKSKKCEAIDETTFTYDTRELKKAFKVIMIEGVVV